jgi:hypothetical protein
MAAAASLDSRPVRLAIRDVPSAGLPGDSAMVKAPQAIVTATVTP